MAASICSDIFTVCVAVSIDCTLTIGADYKQFKIAGYGNHTIVVPFTYVVGTDPDPTHANFGFSVEPSSPSGSYPIGVTVVGTPTFVPATPDLSGDPASVKNGTLTIVFNIAMALTETVSFGVRIILNTGV